MGRRLPSFPIEARPLIHHALVLSLLAAWIAASLTVIASLCASCHRKPSSSPKAPSKSPTSPHSNIESVRKPDSETTPAAGIIQVEQEDESQPPPVPNEEEATTIEMAPDMATHGPILPAVIAPSAKKKLSLSVSTRLPEKMRASRKERSGKAEETIWKKTIILGEKCKVPGDADEEEEAGGGGCDANGNRQKNYRPRTPRSLPVSRTTSFAYSDGGTS